MLLLKMILVMSGIMLSLNLSVSAQKKCQIKRINFPKGSQTLTLSGNSGQCGDFLIRFKKGQRITARLTSVKGNVRFNMMQHPLSPDGEGGHPYCDECTDLYDYFDYTQDWHVSIYSGSYNGLPEGASNYKLTLTFSTPRTIQGGVLNRKAISLPPPTLPDDLEQLKTKVEVKVKVIVDEDGAIRTAEAISGPKFLAVPAERAASGAKFKPTRIGKERVRVAGILIYNFE